ncbi:uncharacterized protein BYT42DRAFT_494501 [Radiomyces spectabilis]|uniref:uncharacterized protein n=1 Tax=Radiomyces spectabilis TaxID=64574 RepID=UPI00221EC219|nr:uncharacterized protein BYT42DRAFT_494501 [Radiomyces spectabilis]KAI8381495.1 hypothetical protein BYT42DRAFT_494501 [Radiomyces spectabilis]
MENLQSLTEDGGVKKRIIKEGVGKQPSKKSTVSVHYTAYLDQRNLKFDSSVDRRVPLTFQLKNGKVVEGWEVAIPTMKIGEVAEIYCTYNYGYGENGRAPLVPPKADLRFEVELLEAWEDARSAAERLEAAQTKKEEGNSYFKAGAVDQALLAYKKGRDFIIDLWDCEPQELVQSREMVVSLQSNIAACYMKKQDWETAIETAKKVLERDPVNIKAYYRIAKCYMELTEYEEGLQFVHYGLQVSADFLLFPQWLGGVALTVFLLFFSVCQKIAICYRFVP